MRCPARAGCRTEISNLKRAEFTTKIPRQICQKISSYSILRIFSSFLAISLFMFWRLPGGNAGHFVYTRDNHTSVLGLREIVDAQKVKIHCLEHEEAFRIFARDADPADEFGNGNSLFVYSAQCNFSGCKYPLMWIDRVHNGILNDSIVTPERCRILTMRCTRIRDVTL